MAQSEIRRMVKQLYRLSLHIRARYKDQLAIEYEGLTLRYATRSPIAKRWFYPRHIGGTREPGYMSRRSLP